MDNKDQGHSLTLALGNLRFNIRNFFSLETARPIEVTFHVEPPWDGGTKVYSNGPGHMTSKITCKRKITN